MITKSFISIALLTTAIVVGSTGFQPAAAQTYSVLYNFTGSADGGHPLAGLTRNSNGTLYGAAFDYGSYGLGAVYELAPTGSLWTYSVLYAFRGSDFSDGAAPASRPVIGPDGHLYGATLIGGLGQGCIAWYNGCGTVYSLTNNSGAWSESVLFQFGTSNGAYPGYGDVVFDQAGNLYDTSPTSGSTADGAAFKLTPTSTWSETILHNFHGTPDGALPLNGPLLDRAGNIYGTTSAGGANGNGAVYELSASQIGWKRITLYDFRNGSDGGAPASNLVMDRWGNLYGATQTGGVYGGGAIFKLTRNPAGTWLFTTIYQFPAPVMAPPPVLRANTRCSGQPFVGSNRTLAIDTFGNLYGTTSADTFNQWGSVFKLRPVGTTWSYSTLHNFNGTTDGGIPWGRLAVDNDGNVYGTAVLQGTYNCGVVFKIVQ
jgi:uncharacterized repeat protein (TIGR03803 family)